MSKKKAGKKKVSKKVVAECNRRNENGALKRVIERFPHLEKRLGGMPYVGIEEDDREFSKPLQGVREGFEIISDILKAWQPGDFNFTNGNPLPVKPFPPCVSQMKLCFDSTMLSKYPYSEGDDNLRLQIVKYLESLGIKNDTPYDFPDVRESGLTIHNLTFTTSTSEAFRYIVRMLATTDDVILTTGPNYGLFNLRAEWNRGRVEIIETKEEDGWLVNPDVLEKRIKEINDELYKKAMEEGRKRIPKVVCFVNTNPNNPLGVVMNKSQKELAERIVDICKRNDIMIVDDLIYQDIVFEETDMPIPLASLDGAFQNVITLLGLSKSYSLAGLRAGVVVADEVIIRQVINKTFRYADATSQLNAVALAGAFNTSPYRNEEYQKYFSFLRKEYKDRLDLVNGLINGFNAIKSDAVRQKAISCVNALMIPNKEKKKMMQGIDGLSIITQPKAGYFIVLDMNILKGKSYISQKTGKRIVINTEAELLKYFYDEYKVRYLPGISILWPNTNDFVGRFTFAKSFEELVEAFYFVKYATERLLSGE